MIREYYKLIICVLMVTFLITACGSHNESVDTSTSGAQTKLYYLNKDKSGLTTIKEELTNTVDEDMISNILHKLSEKPQGKDVLPVIPEGIKINNFNIEGNAVVVNFSESYNKLPDEEFVLYQAGIVYSLTELNFIEEVEFRVNNEPIKDEKGNEVGAMDKSDLYISVDGEYPPREIELTLYFANEDSSALKTQVIKTTYTPNLPIENIIVDLLIKGTKEEGYNVTIPKGIEYNKIQVQNGICTVDFKELFVTKHWGGSESELLTIYSIVNSLTELEDVDSVQFLIDGEKREEFKGHIQFDQLFKRDLSMVEKEEK